MAASVQVTQVTAATPDGAYGAGQSIVLSLHFDGLVNVDTVGGAPTLLLNSGGIAIYIGGSGSNALQFGYLVQAGQNSSDLDYLGSGALAENGASFTDADGAAINTSLPFSGSPGSLGATSNIVIDTIAPTATVTNIVFSADTGSSASDLVTSVATQTIAGYLSSPLGAGERVEVSLNGGGVWMSAVASGDAWALAGQVLSGSNTLQARVVDQAGNIGGVFSRPYVLDITAPTATTTFSFSADSGRSAIDFVTNVASQTISGTLSAALGAGDRLLVSVDNGATYRLANVADGGTAWSLPVTLSGSNALRAYVEDLAGNRGPFFSQAYVLDTSAPLTSVAAVGLSSDTGSSGSDFITREANQTLSGLLSANLAPGEAVLVSLDNGATWVEATAAAGSAAWSLAGQTLVGSNTLQVKVTDLAGNDGPVYAQAYTIKTGATANLDVQFSNDTGASATDLVTSVAAQDISGTLAAPLQAGETLQVSLDNGGSWVTVPTAGSTWLLAEQTLQGSNTLLARVQDLAGNESLYSAPYVLSTVPVTPTPTPPVGAVTQVDGVAVTTSAITLPGGARGVEVSIPVIASDRVEQTGVPGFADVPLVQSGTVTLLHAQLPIGYGLKASGLGNAVGLEEGRQVVDQAIAGAALAPQALQASAHELFASWRDDSSVLVQTLTPAMGSTAPVEPLIVSGMASAAQHTALVIDAGHLSSAASVTLNAVEYVAVVGQANVTGNTAGQVLVGDAASQSFTVSAPGSQVFAGGGDDVLRFAPSSAALQEQAALLHGGKGKDVGVFGEVQGAYRIEQHAGFTLVSRVDEPGAVVKLINVETLQFADSSVAIAATVGQTALATLYETVLGRQADSAGFDFWSSALEGGGNSLGSIALSMAQSSEGASRGLAFNGESGNDLQTLYQSILGREADAPGFAFWSEKMAQGLSLIEVAGSMVGSVELVGQYKAAVEWDFVA